MHPNRRRKKRPNYGLRTVEVNRGPNGFGFTISGQQPCILSCIVAKSPADQAGLRAGDFLISVNGMSVSKSTHDSVVNLIGNSVGPIQMTIAENYYSDSSDEDMDLNRAGNNRKPKYMHRPRIHRNYKHEASGTSVERLGFNSPTKKVMRLQNPTRKQSDTNVINEENNYVENQGGPIEYKALVGYLGTIEMPKQLLPSARLQTVCSCIRKLRQEKRTPTTVLMTVLPTCLTLKNASNQILAIYPTSRVVYISSSTDKDSRYFGLVTSAICDNRSTDGASTRNSYQYSNLEKSLEEKAEIEISNSCHVFVTDFKLLDHSMHLEKADHFKISCTLDVITGSCLEFPRNALYIVSLVQNMYKLQNSTNDALAKNSNFRENYEENPLMANSPQPSASSNSDSGIGFRDDCGNISDRIVVVEFPAQQHLPILTFNTKRPCGITASNALIKNLDVSFEECSNFQYDSYSDVSNIRSKTFDAKLSPSKSNKSYEDDEENKYYSNLNNIRACETVNKTVFERTSDSIENESNSNNLELNPDNFIVVEDEVVRLNNQSEYLNRLTVRAMPDPYGLQDEEHRCITLSTDEVFSERAIDVPDMSPSKISVESICMQSATEDANNFKTSVDNISVHSSKSLEFKNFTNVFKTPSMTKYFENKKSIKRSSKIMGSYDNLMTEQKDLSLSNYKLSPKVYGLSKPNHSCEELNSLENFEKCGYGSLQDLGSLLVSQKRTKRDIAQSEPDVRIPRLQHESRGWCEENGVQSSRQAEAASWTTSFEKLLEDPVGLQAFAEFLKKEFSAENIYFWTACERYRRLSSKSERIKEAQRIYQRHLCVGATEAVNIDSQARQYTEQSLQDADISLLDQAQKQIFNLMKFDSYPRFLKSDLYKQCLSGHVQISFDASLSFQTPGATPSKLKKSLSNAEDRRRKSLLPWHRKNRSRSKDRSELEYNGKNDDSSSIENGRIDGNDIHSSKSSLASQESGKGFPDEFSTNSAARSPLCRVILNNGITTVVQIKQSESIEELVNRVLEKRGLSYSVYEVYTDKHAKSLNISESSMMLAACEVRIEQRVMFKLDLPNRKVIAVKSKHTKIIVDVLKPILNKYTYRLEDVNVTVGNMDYVDILQPVTSIDQLRLHIHLNEGLKEPVAAESQKTSNMGKSVNSASLDEITNKVFKELLHEKADLKCKSGSEHGSIKSEDWGSENSSGILGRFLRRDSAMHEKKKKCLSVRAKGGSNHSSIEDIANESIKKPLIAKWKAGVNKLHVGCSESEKLYEGLNRAQSSRIEDQRGTEINFELPDFLKDKENADNKCQKLRKFKRLDDSVADVSAHSTAKAGNIRAGANYENRNVVVPRESSNNNNISHFNQNHLRIYSPNKLASDESIKTKCNSESSNLDNLKNGEPPPLPPKPKILPMKPSNWGQSGLFKVPRVPGREVSKQNLYLEQPTSSFV